VLDSISIRSPFLTADQAGFFLQSSVERVRRAYRMGKLPLARRLDGGPFEPSRGSRLIPYDELRPLLTDQGQELLDLWQLGRFEIPKPVSPHVPAGFDEVLRSLAASGVVNDQAVGV
jgi:hypothetical protein